MKKLIILTGFIFSTMVCSDIYGQQNPPPGVGDKDLRDNNIKMRSVDLERTKRDAKKDSQTETAPTAGKETEDQLAARYKQIKADYEQIQLSQDIVIKAYQSGSRIDYDQISKSAAEINTSAKSLKLNLFSAPEKTVSKSEAKIPEEKDAGAKKEKSIPNLIVELDNAVGSFATSSMFQNLRVVNPTVSGKTQADLQRIIDLSAELNAVAQKMSGG